MNDLDSKFRDLDTIPSPDLTNDIERRLRNEAVPERPLPRLAPGRRILAAFVALAVFAAAGAFAASTLRHVQRHREGPPPASNPLSSIPLGWARFTSPPEEPDGASLVWAGTVVSRAIDE